MAIPMPRLYPLCPKFGLLLLVGVLAGLLGCSSGPPQKAWHTERLTEEFTADMLDTGVSDFSDYLALEDRLFQQLHDKVYAKAETGPEHALNRYSEGSAADPNRASHNWNRSFEFVVERPVGGVLLLHGMSDSPYSLRALGHRLHREGYHVIGLRLPGHGTAPSGLRFATWQDMAAAAGLAIRHLVTSVGHRPLHIVGYSTGAALAVDAALGAVEQPHDRMPASLVLISPAIRVHSVAALAGFKDTLATLPGLDQWAYLTVMDEFDPFKYNSFATNAGAQVHQVTLDVDRRVQTLSADQAAAGKFPPILVVKSAVDATVSTDAVVDNLLGRLSDRRNALILFDINRNAAIKSSLLISDPGPLTNRLIDDADLPFAVTFVTNQSPDSIEVVARHKAPNTAEMGEPEPLDLVWPRAVVSLSHVALPIPPDDPLYGLEPPVEKQFVYLGNLAIKGERGLLKVSPEWLLRLRFNPFYAYLEDRVVEWLELVEGRSTIRVGTIP